MEFTGLKNRRPSGSSLGVAILAALYLIAIFADFLSTCDYREQVRLETSAPPSNIRLWDEHGTFHGRPFIYKSKIADFRTLRYEEDRTPPYDIGLMVAGSPYRLFGLIPVQTHLLGVVADDGKEAPRLRLLGTDQLGRDRFSRLLNAARFSLFVSPIGVLLACVIGIGIGAVSGYSGHSIDRVLMGITDGMMALPTLILILAARAAFPLELSPLTAAMLLVAIFALTGWAEMARLTRGLAFSAKQLDFVLAARAAGASEPAILFRHIMPNIAGPLVVQGTLMLASFLLAETALSFLGVGLQEPEPSLGNMLSAAADLSLLRNSPVLSLAPAAVIFLYVLAVHLIGRGRQSDNLRNGA